MTLWYNRGRFIIIAKITRLHFVKITRLKKYWKNKKIKKQKTTKKVTKIKTMKEGDNTQRSEEIKSTATITLSFKNITKLF